MHFALLVAPTDEIGVEHLKLTGGALAGSSSVVKESPPRERIVHALQSLLDAPGQSLFNDLEKIIVEEAFRHSHFNQVRAAAQLGISRNVLRTLLKKHGYLGDRADADAADDGGTDSLGQSLAVG